MEKRAIIIGAGPAGLTAAYELLKRTDIKPVILEKSGYIGGISRTVEYKGNRMDMGPHRFFSKSDRVMDWWFNMMPLDSSADSVHISYQNKTREISGNGASVTEDKTKKLLVIERLTRIYFLRKFFVYPLQLSFNTLSKLGAWRTIKIIFSYLVARLFPIKNEKSLQDFIINRFGRELYLTFFKDYTEKVWGIPCEQISAEWGAQRIKGVSISKAIEHAVKSAWNKAGGAKDIHQKGTETSLIEQFLYPAFGAGQMWEEVARSVEAMGGKILFHENVEKIYTKDGRVTSLVTVNSESGLSSVWTGEHFVSTMPVQELIAGMSDVPPAVKEVAAGLMYRDFVNVGVLLKNLRASDGKRFELKDSWIYIQDVGVRVGRIQIYNNWGPYMVKDPNTTWIGLEYFCNKEDDFWKQHDEAVKQVAIQELEKIGLAHQEDVLDITVQRQEKTYPAYFGTYDQFSEVRDYVDQFGNLFLVGRNGMHKYNNTDHSMLTAMVAVDNICEGITAKENLWSINTEQEYHEEKKETPVSTSEQLTPAAEGSVGGMTVRRAFREYVFGQYKRGLWLILFALVAQFTIFKMIFPHVNYIPDSYNYIEAAYRNMTINMWPVGYSKVLRIFSAFFRSDMALAIFQYIVLEVAVFYFVFTVTFIMRPGKEVMRFLLVFYAVNPLLLMISNYVLADAWFTALTVLWITELIWLTTNYNRYSLLVLPVLLVVLLMTRFNAIYYPFVTLIVLLAVKGTTAAVKTFVLGASAVLIGIFLWHNGNQYRDLTGKRQFSAFGGWQVAANSLIMMSKMPTGEITGVPEELRPLHLLVLKELDSLNHLKKRPDSLPGIYFLWDESSPLLKYMEVKYPHDTATRYFKKWSTLSPLYAKYGEYIISHHPMAYVQHYILPNLGLFFVPPPEFLSLYNMKSDEVKPLAKDFFGYKSTKIFSRQRELPIASIYPTVNTLSNGTFILGSLGFLIFGGLRRVSKSYRAIVITVSTLWIFNFGFSVLAAPIVLRYQILCIIFFMTIGICLFEHVLKSDSDTPKAKA